MALAKKDVEQWKMLAEVARGLDDLSVPLDVRQRSALAVAVVARDALPALFDELERRAAWILRLLGRHRLCPECGGDRKKDGGFTHQPACPLAKFLASIDDR